MFTKLYYVEMSENSKIIMTTGRNVWILYYKDTKVHVCASSHSHTRNYTYVTQKNREKHDGIKTRVWNILYV